MVTGIFIFGLLVIFILNPTLLYANKTSIANYSIYHNNPVNKKFQALLQQSGSIIKSSELYNPELTIDICLKDGSAYPTLIEKVLGRDPIVTFYNKVVFTGDEEINFDNNYIKFDGHKLNLTEMLAHVQVHCLEFKKYGFWKSNPIANHPKWKCEGYAEYIARQHSGDKNLKDNIQKLLQPQRINNTEWMTLADSTEIITTFFKYRILIQYCVEVKRISIVQLMEDNTSAETVTQQMIAWYSFLAIDSTTKN